MDKKLALYAAVMLLGVFLSSIAQVMLKKSAQKKHHSLLREYLNVPVMAAYAIFFLATFLSIYAYKVIPLSMGPVLESTGYLYVTIFGVTIFHERLSLQKVVALGMILVGIAVYSLFG